MKKISWITPDYFVDCDINIIPALLKDYQVEWFVLLPQHKSRFQESEFSHLLNLPNLTLHLIRVKHRVRDPRTFMLYFNLFRQVKNSRPDIIYVNHTATPYFALLALLFFNRNKTIYTAHQGAVHSGFKFKAIFTVFYGLVYSWFKHINLFSESEAAQFTERHPQKKTFIIPLALKDFGSTNHTRATDKIVFFNFGTIRPSKNIELLIDAACKAYDAGYQNFHVVIAGQCDEWSFYEQRITHPQLFTCDIGLISNSQIAEMFESYHYLVLPYKIVTQSGPLKIALNYGVPLIVSDLEGFTSEITHGKTGYIFKNDDVESLTEVLKLAIDRHYEGYKEMQANVTALKNEKYSTGVIIDQYKGMFDVVLSPSKH